MAGKEHLSTIEFEEEYIQSLVTGTLHRATKQPTQWSCVCPSEIDWHSHYAFTTLNSQHIKSPRLLPACRSCRWLRQYNLVTLSLITASELKSILFKAKTQTSTLLMYSKFMLGNRCAYRSWKQQFTTVSKITQNKYIHIIRKQRMKS